jgi:acyl-CoA thioester hydrolase
VHHKTIEIRWRDVDQYGHVNNAVYLTYLEEVRDEWLARALASLPASGGAVWDYVVAHISIDFRHEIVPADDEIVASCALERIGTSSVRTREQVHTAGGELAADARAVLVARDRDAGRSRQITAEERAAFERELPAATPPPAAAGERP